MTLAELNLKLIWDVISTIRIGQGGCAYVVDQQGRLMAHPDIGWAARRECLRTRTAVPWGKCILPAPSIFEPVIFRETRYHEAASS
jgi:adenylate cyclase